MTAALQRLARPRFDAHVMTVHGGRPQRFVCPADADIACLSGVAWITTALEVRDVVLHAGQAHHARRGDRLFINAMPACELRLAPAGRVQPHS